MYDIHRLVAQDFQSSATEKDVAFRIVRIIAVRRAIKSIPVEVAVTVIAHEIN